MTCNRYIPSVVNILKNLLLSYYLLDEFPTRLYYDKIAASEYLFKEFTQKVVNRIEHPWLTKEWEFNPDKAAYDKYLVDSVGK